MGVGGKKSSEVLPNTTKMFFVKFIISIKNMIVIVKKSKNVVKK